MGQMGEVHNGSAAVDFHLAMVLGNGLGEVVRSASEVPGPFQGPCVPQVVVVPLLVGLDARHMVRALVPDLAYAGLPASHRIHGHDTSRAGTASVPGGEQQCLRWTCRPLPSEPGQAVGVEPVHALAVNGHPRPSVSVPALRTRAGKPASNQVASSRVKTRPSVSCEGLPFGSFRKVRSQVSLNREVERWPRSCRHHR